MSKSETPTFAELSIAALKRAGCRVTKQRRAVIDCIAGAKHPLSAPEVYEKLEKSSLESQPDKVSVYRILDTLHELKIVHKVAPSGGYLACNHQACRHSYHIISHCTGCKSVEEMDVPNEVVAPLFFHMKNALKFEPDSHLLHMDGLCDGCAENP